jgi:hypothetical protein
VDDAAGRQISALSASAAVSRVLLMALGLTSSTLSATQSDVPPPLPVATITAGIGNAMGWFGAQGEGYFAHGRLSAFGGVGYTPAVDDFGASGLTVAAGLRGYTAGGKHRGFAEASACQVATVSDLVEPKRFYGPCVQAGYQFASRGGFTLVLSTGVGYALGAAEYGNRAQALIGLGLGYTWRQRSTEASSSPADEQ